MEDNEILASYKRFGFRMTVYPTHIAITEGTLLRKDATIFIGDVTGVEVTRTGKLAIITRDGRRRVCTLGLKAKKMRDAIMRARANA